MACTVDAVDEADARRQLALRQLRVISLEPVQAHATLAAAACRSASPCSVNSWCHCSMPGCRWSRRWKRWPEEATPPAAHAGADPGTAVRGPDASRRRWPSTRGLSPHLYVASVRASERTGALREALTRYIAYQQRPTACARPWSTPASTRRCCSARAAGDAVSDGLRGAALQLHLRGCGQRSAASLAHSCCNGGSLSMRTPDVVGLLARRCACAALIYGRASSGARAWR